ncbi:MAG: T9SS type A sorting domain-containing protein [Chitinophagales bacterium]|nr:T9SS type A sorting domain-containing protein [Chitinophagales bacterium]
MKKDYSSLIKKLKQYSALAAPLIGAATAANAQIVYTNVQPDATISKNQQGYPIDLDQDGTNDFIIGVIDTVVQFSDKDYFFHEVLADPYNDNSVVATTFQSNGFTFVYPIYFNKGNVIKPELGWNNAASQTMADFQGYVSTNGNGYGSWNNVTDKYLGLRIKKGSKEYYGWARLDIKASKDTVYFTLKDYAVQSTPDTAIEAGDNGGVPTGIFQTTTNDIAIFAYENQVHVSAPSSSKGSMLIRLMNMQGQDVKVYSVNQNQYQFTVADLPRGLYMVSVEQEGTIKTRKISLR